MGTARALLVVLLGVVGPAVFVVALPFALAAMTPPGWGIEMGAWRFVALVPWSVGAAVALWSAGAFTTTGRGTPTSAAPPTTLVAHGLYRYVRNPMYVGALLVVVGTAVWSGSLVVVAYAGALLAGFHAFVVGYEEPRLHDRFGASYDRFRQRVPRWVPRPPASGGEGS